MAMSALVLAGLPTTRILTSFFALLLSAAPCGLKIPPLALSRSLRSIPALRGIAPTSRATSTSPNATSGIVGAHDILQQRKGTVVELHLHAAERAKRWSDLQQLQDDRGIGAEHRPGCDPEQQAVTDLAGSPGDGNANRCSHAAERRSPVDKPQKPSGWQVQVPRE